MATTCKHKIGLLSLRDCKAPTAIKCQSCGRPVCEEHHRSLVQERAERVLCVECYLERTSGVDTAGSNEYQRRELYRSTKFQPFYHGSSQRYGQEDYEYFDREAGAGFAAAAAGGMMNEMMDAEDMMSAEDFQDS
ncbi:MAG: hypothetical protein GY801_49305 [bacterium]|nr:hypothetical protein [bacterium]